MLRAIALLVLLLAGAAEAQQAPRPMSVPSNRAALFVLVHSGLGALSATGADGQAVSRDRVEGPTLRYLLLLPGRHILNGQPTSLAAGSVSVLQFEGRGTGFVETGRIVNLAPSQYPASPVPGFVRRHGITGRTARIEDLASGGVGLTLSLAAS